MVENLKNTNKCYNIFIIRTPYQLVNAYEAIEYFNIENNVLVIIDNGTENNKNQLTEKIENSKWDCVIRFGENSRSNFFRYLKLIKELNKYNLNNLYLGSGFNKIQQIFMANLNINRIVLIDAGTSTLVTYNNFKHNKTKIPLWKQLRFLFFGLRIKIKKPIDFFTMFELESLPNNKIYRNTYSYLRKKHKVDDKISSKEIYIIGQKFVVSNILEEKEYFKYLDKILEDYNGYKVNYLLHRTEKIEYLENSGYSEKMNLISSTMPGEEFFLKLEQKPEYIVGSVSTLLISLYYIFNDINIVSYKFNEKVFKSSQDLYRLEYENLKQNNIKIVNL